MAAPDPRVVAERIRAETGIDLFDTSGDAAAASAAMRRTIRQVAGTFGASVVGAVALFLVVAAFASGHPGTGGQVGLVGGGLAVACCAAAVGFWAWRTPARYRELYLPRHAARRRFLAEIGQPWDPLGSTSALGRKALVAYSTPADVRELREAQRKQRDEADQSGDEPEAQT